MQSYIQSDIHHTYSSHISLGRDVGVISINMQELKLVKKMLIEHVGKTRFSYGGQLSRGVVNPN